jgi:diguanylate cyclase (GGDEF)-like protein
MRHVQRLLVDRALRRLRVGAALLLTVWLVVPPRHGVGGFSVRAELGAAIAVLLGCNLLSLVDRDNLIGRASVFGQFAIDAGLAFGVVAGSGMGTRGVAWIALSMPVLEAAMRFGLVGEAIAASLVAGAYGVWSWRSGSADAATVGVRMSAVLLVGMPCGYFASQMATELHSLSALTQRLAYRASHDPLTGLANRAFLLERLDRVAAAAGPRNPSALLFVDLDGFKKLNDTFGHDVGNDMLVDIAVRLRETVPEAFVARLGGDEFAVLLWPTSANFAEVAAQRIVDGLRSNHSRADATVTVTASVGLAMSYGGDAPPLMLRQADLAMYQAKSAGRARWSYCLEQGASAHEPAGHVGITVGPTP